MDSFKNADVTCWERWRMSDAIKSLVLVLASGSLRANSAIGAWLVTKVVDLHGFYAI